MTVVGSMSASGRRALIVLGLAALCAASEARAQQAPAPAPSAPAQTPQTPAPGAPAPGAPAAPAAPEAEPPDPLKFSTDSALIIWTIKPEMVADFEKVMGLMRSRLSGSDNPELKALGDSMKGYKPAVAGKPGEPVTYFTRIDPASKTLSYNPRFIFFEAKKADGMPLFERAEADELYKLLFGAIAGVNALPLTTLP